jgi:hypothetical protein
MLVHQDVGWLLVGRKEGLDPLTIAVSLTRWFGRLAYVAKCDAIRMFSDEQGSGLMGLSRGDRWASTRSINCDQGRDDYIPASFPLRSPDSARTSISFVRFKPSDPESPLAVARPRSW